jgi:hypothetical protein
VIEHSGVYATPDDLLAEFFDDPADRAAVKREAERLAAEECCSPGVGECRRSTGT